MHRVLSNAIAIAHILIAPAQAFAQSPSDVLPAACLRPHGRGEVASANSPEPDGGVMTRTMVERIRAGRAARIGTLSGELAEPGLDDLFRAAPGLAEWNLAYLIVSPDRLTDREARRAAMAYRHYKGDPEVMVAAVLAVGGYARRLEVLNALIGPVDGAVASMVIRYACDAMWMLSAASRDRAYWVNLPTWTHYEFEVLYGSYALLSSDLREGFVAPILRLDIANGADRLKSIHGRSVGD